MLEPQTGSPMVAIERLKRTATLGRLFTEQGRLCQRAYYNMLTIEQNTGVFTDFEQQEALKTWLRAYRTLDKIAKKLEEATGKSLGPLELYYV